ncbi:MAG: hypothetical protein H7A45_15060 [Verrucomicrobiales bacterium]|nr:hypothetical protein [Verrucomicrobiales bacterium]
MKTSLQPKPHRLALGLAALAAGSALAVAGERGPVRFTVDPMGEPVPALRYTLVDEKIDQTPGNAALAYQRVARMLAADKTWTEQKDQWTDWLGMPLADFPPDAVRQLLDQHRNNLEQLLKATRYEQCDWGTRIREEGFSALLPHLAELRGTARLLALDIRRLVREGRYDEAVVRLRAGMTLARHAAAGDLLIEGLVGVAIANTMLDRIEEMISQPDAPNLYWALADLPPGYLSAWQSTRWERSCVYVELPLLRFASDQAVTADDFRRAISDFQSLAGGDVRPGWLPPEEAQALHAAGIGLAAYPRACQQLIARGRSAEEVQQMSVARVLTTYIGESYAILRDDLFKWFALPYQQARRGIEQADADLQKAIVNDPVGSIIPRLVLPSLNRVLDRFVDLDRRLAALRCVEAIRAHAVGLEGELPTSLAELRPLPAPLDPVTGAPFGYRIEAATAHLESPKAPDGERPGALEYLITLRP